MNSRGHDFLVRKASAKIVQAPLVMPFRIATGQHNNLENVFFAIELADGIRGFGEAAVAQHITGETVPMTLANLKAAAAALEGCDISDPFAVCWSVRGRFKGNHAALAAFEMAVLDAFARALKIPFWSLFGARPVPLTTDITVVIGSLDEASRFAQDFYGYGFRSFKIKVGRDTDLDLARVMAVRRHARRAAIILDANQAFTAEGMLRFLRDLKIRGIMPVLLEQPVPKDDIDGLKKLTRLSGVPVCADESAGSLKAVTRLLQDKAVNAVNIKLMKSGILEAVEIAALARAKGARLMIGAMMESALSITAAAHVAAGLGCFDFIDLDTTFFIKGRLSSSPYLSKSGQFDVSRARPGIGVKGV